jgi:CRISPR/Cas system CSM-associated protein Csm2 small subunit
MVIQSNVELADEGGLEGVNEHDVKELMQSHGKSLSNDKLQELAERIQSEFTASDTKNTSMRTVYRIPQQKH